MRHDQFTLRCYAEKQGEIFVAVCVDLSLAAQANTMDEARRKLDEQIAGYLQDIFHGDEVDHIRDLFPRRAPWHLIARYYVIGLICRVRRVLDGLDGARCRMQAFREFWPALVAS